MSKYHRSYQRLAFAGEKPVLVAGRQYMTLRVGDKWIKNKLAGKDKVVLLDPYGHPFGTATVHDVFYLPLANVPMEWLLWDHKTSVHTHAGALATLRAIYGSAERGERRQDVYPDTPVSAVFFMVDAE